MDDLGIKIISDIDCHFSNDPEINEYDILPLLDSSKNRSPVFVVDHKMAIEAWAARIMLSTAGSRVAWFQSTARTKFSPNDASELLSMTRAVLLVVADHMTSWNFRILVESSQWRPRLLEIKGPFVEAIARPWKRLVQQEYLNIQDDIALGDLIVYKHRKTPETFAHRRWLLQQLLPEQRVFGECPFSKWNTTRLSNTLAHSEVRHKAVRHELDVCTQTADRYPNNYHAWSHRLWVVENLACCVPQVITEELVSLEHFVTRHVSDHSGFHYRQFLLNCIPRVQPGFCTLDEYRSLLRSELQLTAELNRLYMGHEAIWYHRRFVLNQMVRSCSPLDSTSDIGKSSSATVSFTPVDVIDEKLLVTKETQENSRAENGTGNGDSILEEEIASCEEILAERLIERFPWHRTLVERQVAWTRAVMTRTLKLH